MGPAEMRDKFIIVEGHRDVYELLYRRSLAEENPLRNAIAPRLIRDGIDACVYAICGDSYAHSQNTGRYLETAFENIDIFLEEMAQSDGMISLIRTKADGLGLDFTKYDGPRPLEDRPDRRPRETPSIKRFEEVEDLYNLVEVLQKRGFKEADIAKILGENYLRVLRDVL